MSRIKCFLVVESSLKRYYLRRYSDSAKRPCPNGAYHHAWEHYYDQQTEPEKPESDDPRWPFKCEKCSYYFGEDDAYQLFCQRLFDRPDTGEQFEQTDLPVGAMYSADWITIPEYVGKDGKVACVKTPGGTWFIDSRASNCTRKDDNEHKCWIRHGTMPEITVDKNGDTCGAGAGSILIGRYHGFLRNGYLEEC